MSGDIIVGVNETRYKLLNQSVVVDGRANILELIRQRLEMLTVGRNIREISHVSVGEVILKSGGMRMFFILEYITQSIPSRLCHGVGFKNGSKRSFEIVA